jgi:hypothetical protein
MLYLGFVDDYKEKQDFFASVVCFPIHGSSINTYHDALCGWIKWSPSLQPRTVIRRRNCTILLFTTQLAAVYLNNCHGFIASFYDCWADK